MKKNIYRATKVKLVNKEKLATAVEGKELVFSVDVAKENMYAAFVLPDGHIALTITWTHPAETNLVLDMVMEQKWSSLDVVMEPTCTYADCLRYQFHNRGQRVYQVNTKQSHDYREIHDGVPSSHDAKSAAVIAALHAQGKSKEWLEKHDHERDLRAAVTILELHQDCYLQNLNRLGHLLARHWPELEKVIELSNASTLEMLIEFGCPAAVVREAAKARHLLRKIGGHLLASEKIEAVISTAEHTLGVSATAIESETIKTVAAEIRRADQKSNKAREIIEDMVIDNETIANLARAEGKVTAAVIYALVGNPLDYPCAAAYLKAAGLNLKERSSGKYKGQLKITKRGSSVARKYLYMSVLRHLQKDIYFKAWLDRKMVRDGGRKKRGLVALMRKLVKGLWHVARGAHFRSDWLFDTRRLKLSPAEEMLT